MKDLSFPTRDQTCAPCSGAQNSNHWATYEFPAIYIFNARQLCLKVAPPDTKNPNSSIRPPASGLPDATGWAPPSPHAALRTAWSPAWDPLKVPLQCLPVSSRMESGVLTETLLRLPLSLSRVRCWVSLSE